MDGIDSLKLKKRILHSIKYNKNVYIKIMNKKYKKQLI